MEVCRFVPHLGLSFQKNPHPGFSENFNLTKLHWLTPDYLLTNRKDPAAIWLIFYTTFINLMH